MKKQQSLWYLGWDHRLLLRWNGYDQWTKISCRHISERWSRHCFNTNVFCLHYMKSEAGQKTFFIIATLLLARRFIFIFLSLSKRFTAFRILYDPSEMGKYDRQHPQ